MENNIFLPSHWFENSESRPWHGLKQLTTMLVVQNIDKAIEIYQKVCGFICIFKFGDLRENTLFSRLRYPGDNFILQKEKSFNFAEKSPKNSRVLPPYMFYLYIEDIDSSHHKAIHHAFEALEEPYDTFWKNRKAGLCDPFRYRWDIAHKII